MTTSPFANKTYAILGLGRSGLATAQALQEEGATIYAWDDIPESRQVAIAQGFQVTPLDAQTLKNCDALVVSPGIPLLFPKPHPVILEAKSLHVPITGDLDIFFKSHPESTFIGITGTNGKSTTTALIGHLLKHAGKKASVGGNIGIPVLSLKGEPGEYKVLEVSSYQLDINPMLTNKIGVLLNITPDHLDRHGSFENYVATKKKIFQHQSTDDMAIIGVDDPNCQYIARELQVQNRQKVIPFSIEHLLPHGLYTQDGVLFDGTSGTPKKIYDCKTHPRLKGQHNWQNMVACYAVGLSLKIETPTILEAINSFPGLEHRQEYVASSGTIDFINDSKATNGDAAAKALACFDNIYWIIGGLAKQDGLIATAPYFSKIKHAFLIGKAAPNFALELKGKVPFTIAETLDKATGLAHQMAMKDALPHATILLSPACASWDQFKDFEARGKMFKDYVQEILAPAIRAQ